MATYIHGNTVRKEAASVQTRKPTRPKKRTHISRGYVGFVSIATVIALFACVGYVNLQSEVINRSRNVVAMQQTLNTMQDENIAREDSILNAMSLEEINKIATGRLGMVSADSNEIIRYKNPVGNQITQYCAIPENGIYANAAKID